MKNEKLKITNYEFPETLLPHSPVMLPMQFDERVWEVVF